MSNIKDEEHLGYSENSKAETNANEIIPIQDTETIKRNQVENPRKEVH